MEVLLGVQQVNPSVLGRGQPSLVRDVGARSSDVIASFHVEAVRKEERVVMIVLTATDGNLRREKKCISQRKLE
jgi:hypothetical protein